MPRGCARVSQREPCVVPGPALSPGTPRPGPAVSYSPAGCSQHRAGCPAQDGAIPTGRRAQDGAVPAAPTSCPSLKSGKRRLIIPCSVPPATCWHRGQLPKGHHGAGRGRSRPRAPRQLREGAGWVLAWARKRLDPLLSAAANAKSIRHVSAPRGNRLRPAEGSSQGRGRRLGGSAQGGRPGMCRAKAQKAADILHPPPQPAPSCPALDPCPEGCGAPAAPGGRRQRVPLRGRAPSGLPALAAPLWALRARIPAHSTSLQEPEPLLEPPQSGRAWGGERDPAGARDAPLGAGTARGAAERGRGDATGMVRGRWRCWEGVGALQDGLVQVDFEGQRPRVLGGAQGDSDDGRQGEGAGAIQVLQVFLVPVDAQRLEERQKQQCGGCRAPSSLPWMHLRAHTVTGDHK